MAVNQPFTNLSGLTEPVSCYVDSLSFPRGPVENFPTFSVGPSGSEVLSLSGVVTLSSTTTLLMACTPTNGGTYSEGTPTWYTAPGG